MLWKAWPLKLSSTLNIFNNLSIFRNDLWRPREYRHSTIILFMSMFEFGMQTVIMKDGSKTSCSISTHNGGHLITLGPWSYGFWIWNQRAKNLFCCQPLRPQTGSGHKGGLHPSYSTCQQLFPLKAPHWPLLPSSSPSPKGQRQSNIQHKWL